jgi:type IV pilus assembly protein PilZ
MKDRPDMDGIPQVDNGAEKAPTNHRGGINMLSISIRDPEVLHACWMPFLENGGLFIPGESCHEMGDEVFLLCSLMDEPERIPVTGSVVWVTPANAENKKAQGIGVQFRDSDNTVRPVIEKILAGKSAASQSTHTI